MCDQNLYGALGTTAGTTSDGIEIVGILIPKGAATNDEEIEVDEVWLTIPAAKALLIDLQAAISAAIEHKT